MSTNRLVTAAIVSVVFAATIPAVSVDASAQSASCVRLQSQLSQLQRTSAGRNTRKFNKWNKAARQQRAALQRASAQSRRAGCRAGLFSRPKPVCNALKVKIGRMQANLAKLQKGRDRYAGGGNRGAEERILAKMRRMRCGQQDVRVARLSDEKRYKASSRRRNQGLLSLLFDGQGRRSSSVRVSRARMRDMEEDRWRRVDPNAMESRWDFDRDFEPDQGYDYDGVPGFGGSYRTLCVRTCDGYYFPISFTTSSRNFKRDQAVCAAMCPAADVRLYVHRNPGEESEDMVSVDGEPYAKLETAFSYRESYNPSCGCGRVTSALTTLKVRGDGTGLERITLSGDEFNTKSPNEELRKSLPIPQPKLPHDEDPDTVINVEGRFTPSLAARASQIGGDTAATASVPVKKRVRQVGTTFYVDQ